MPSLKKTFGDKVEILQLAPGVTNIGRAAGNHIIVPISTVSKIHAVVTWDGSQCTLENKGTNGTFLNGQKIAELATLRDGDQFRIAGYQFVFIEHESAADLSQFFSGPTLVKLVRSSDTDPERSVRHLAARPGNDFTVNVTEEHCPISPEKVVASITLTEQTISSLVPQNAVKKLSHVLRFIGAVRTFAFDCDMRPALLTLTELFPQAQQVVFATDFADDFRHYRVAGAVQTDGSESAVVCADVIHRTASQSQCLLLADIWRTAPKEKPTLSGMERVSLMCVPIINAAGCFAVIQLFAREADPEFDAQDLERLAILAQLFAIAMPSCL